MQLMVNLGEPLCGGSPPSCTVAVRDTLPPKVPSAELYRLKELTTSFAA